jgi:oligoribonuclease NrnB/cAMP/cGMP phosphodiesterase (DHH superfamily)
MNLCIYHGGCTDGVAAAWVVHEALADVEFHPGVYQEDPPDVTGRHVILVDFSYKRPVLERMLEQCRSMTILDHHKTAKDDLEDILSEKAMGVFDMDRCGALIAWNWYFPGVAPPVLIKDYIDNRDRWTGKGPEDTDQVTMALRSYDHSPKDSWAVFFRQWSSLMDRNMLPNLRREGADIHRYFRQRVEEAKLRARTMFIDGVQFLVANDNYSLCSEVAGELAEVTGYGAIWWQNADGSVTFSLRGRGVDVSAIAKKFGGGGHPGAAGFRVADLQTFLELK